MGSKIRNSKCAIVQLLDRSPRITAIAIITRFANYELSICRYPLRIRPVLIIARLAVHDHENEQYYSADEGNQADEIPPSAAACVVQPSHG